MNARAILVSKCTIPNARKSTAKASLIGKAVQKAGQRVPNPSFVGEICSFMPVPDDEQGTMNDERQRVRMTPAFCVHRTSWTTGEHRQDAQKG
jgi:hypothetical protein